MILCPDCRRPFADLDTPACLHCGWQLEWRDGIPVMLSQRDRTDPTFVAYLDNYDTIAADDLRESLQPPALLDAQTDRIAKLAGEVAGLDACDIGIGQGRLVRSWLAAGAASVTGVDIALDYLQRLEGTSARLVIANAENLPFENEFDVLVASDILEHVLNPGDMLMSAHAALRPGGRFLVRVPYREDLRQYGALVGSPYRFVHLRAFTRDVLRMMLEQAGFQVERLVFDGFLRDRVRPALIRSERVERRVRAFLDRFYPTDEELHRMDSRLGALLLRPNTLTAVARKEERT